jgi:hypothetical protein
MNENEALIFLGIDSIYDSTDVIELKIFELKKQIIAQNHVPQLLISKLDKLLKLKRVRQLLGLETERQTREPMEINPINSDFLIEAFNIFHHNRTTILHKLSNSFDIDKIINCVNALLENLKSWSSKWPLIEENYEHEVKLSSEIDSMLLLNVLKDLKSQNVISFSDLSLSNLPNNVLIEIKRLNLISEYYKKMK